MREWMAIGNCWNGAEKGNYFLRQPSDGVSMCLCTRSVDTSSFVQFFKKWNHANKSWRCVGRRNIKTHAKVKESEEKSKTQTKNEVKTNSKGPYLGALLLLPSLLLLLFFPSFMRLFRVRVAFVEQILQRNTKVNNQHCLYFTFWKSKAVCKQECEVEINYRFETS